MKKVAILSNYKDSFEVSSDVLSAYQELTHVFRKHDIELRRVSMHSFDTEKKLFRDYVDMDDSGQFRIFHESYNPDVIWNRSWDGYVYAYDLMEKAGISVFPSAKIFAIDGDKYEMSLFLQKYQPKALLLKDFFESKTSREELQNRVVLKPIRSFSWHGIEFYTQQELLNNKEKYFWLGSLYIVQDFKDFSKGIPGLTNGICDIRLVYIGGQFSHATMRIPAAWSLKSNVWSGWSELYLEKRQVPEMLFPLAEDVLRDLDLGNNSILSIDFGYVLDENRWYVFEINSSPGVYFWSSDPEQCRAFYDAYFLDVIHFFKSQYFS